MPWVSVDDHFDDHPKFKGLSDAAIGGFLRALAWCSRNLTDGAITRDAWPELVRTPAARAALLERGIVRETADGFLIHDYLDYQPSRDEVLRKREAARQRMGVRRKFPRSSREQPANSARSSATPRTPVQDQAGPPPYDDDVPPIRESPSSLSPPPLVPVTSLDWQKQRNTFAYIGQRLKVPHKLHAESRDALGGAEPDLRLKAWYDDLDADLVLSGEPLPDVFKWLRPKREAWLSGLTPAAVPVAARVNLDAHAATADYHAERQRAAERRRGTA